MKHLKAFFWPLAGLAAVGFSFWLLWNDPSFRHLTAHDIYASLNAISVLNYGLAVAATLVAYSALAWYDRIALLHLGRVLPLPFISIVSFTTYALSHNIGASAFSGAVVRYRAYSTRGLTIVEIGILVAFCAFTFLLGSLLLGGLALVIDPEILLRLFPVNAATGRLAGAVMLAFVLVYVLGSVFNLNPLVIGKFRLAYPRIGVVVRQLLAGPLELLGAAGIIYFSLSDANGPSFFIVLAAFLASFSAALLSHAPGGLGVLEYVFLKALPNVPTAKLLAALIVFRIFYLIIPLIFAIIAVVVFERAELARALKGRRRTDTRPIR